MFLLCGYYTQENLLNILSSNKDSTYFIFHVNQDENISNLNTNSENLFFIKTPSFIIDGKQIDNGYLVYKSDLKIKFFGFNSNVDLVIANLKNSSIKLEKAAILSNIIKNDDGNNLIFFLYNFLGMNANIVGIDFEETGKNAIYYKGSFFNYYFLIFETPSNIEYIKYDDFWEDYLGPFIITDAFDGGFKNISWQNPMQFFNQKIHSLSYENIENSIKYFPLKVFSLKNEYSIIKLKVDFTRSIDVFYNDISIFSYQYAYIEKCNIHLFFDRIHKITTRSKNGLRVLAGNLLEIIRENTSFNLRSMMVLNNFTGISANLIVLPTKSTPMLTTNCLFAL